MENKLRRLLMEVEDDSSVEKCSDDSFMSIDESMAMQIRANYGGFVNNGTCGSNTDCSNNGTCTGNGTCNDNKVCQA